MISFLSDLSCSACGCEEIVITSSGNTNEAHEFHDANDYNLRSEDANNYQFWENVTYNEEVEKYNKMLIKNPGEKLKKRIDAVDIHSEKYSSLWKKYNGTFSKHLNLNYKDLLGTYHLTSCSEDYLKKLSPVYKKVLQDGTEAFLYKKPLGGTWHVMQIISNILHNMFRNDNFVN